MLSIYKKEVNQFFTSPTGYVVLGVFFVVMGLMLWFFPDTNLLNQNFASLDIFFSLAPIIFVFLIPAIMMRTFSEELQLGTIEFLFTAPLKLTDIILGKFLAGITLLLIATLPLIIYYFTLYTLGSPIGNIDSGGTLGSYIGLLLLGATFAAISLFTSALQSNQMVSFLIGVFICAALLWGFDYTAKLPIFFGRTDDLVQQCGMSYHYNALSRGLLTLTDLTYFVSLIALFLFLTYLILNKKKS